MRIALLVAVAACAPASSVAPSVAPLAQNRRAGGEPALRFRQLTTGTLPRHARRTTFVLVGEGDHATLTETEERAQASSIAEADHAHWVVRSTRTYSGRRRLDGGAQDLELATPEMQPLNLHCATATLEVAEAGARRVPSPDRGPDSACGDRGVWNPPATSRVDAIVCGPAGPSTDDADDDDRLVFAPDPGVEWAYQNDDCVLRGGGFRRIAR